MSAAKGMNVYLSNHYEGMSPEKLIHMLYQGALKHLESARKGVKEKDPKKRGEHLGKVISIISELNASIDPEINDDSTQFLRGLYTSMLTELPKVSITNDIKTLDLAASYIEKLNQIWETQVLNYEKHPDTPPASKKINPSLSGYGSAKGGISRSIFA